MTGPRISLDSITDHEIELKRELGSGHFGVVYQVNIKIKSGDDPRLKKILLFLM